MRRISVLIEREQWEKIEALSEDKDRQPKMTPSEHFREALRLYLKIVDIEDKGITSQK